MLAVPLNYAYNYYATLCLMCLAVCVYFPRLPSNLTSICMCNAYVAVSSRVSIRLLLFYFIFSLHICNLVYNSEYLYLFLYNGCGEYTKFAFHKSFERKCCSFGAGAAFVRSFFSSSRQTAFVVCLMLPSYYFDCFDAKSSLRPMICFRSIFKYLTCFIAFHPMGLGEP